MKQAITTIKTLGVLTLLAIAAGCASHVQETQNMALSAGFKVLTPKEPDQAAILKTLPADKITEVNYKGKTYYVLPDLKNNQAYVGQLKQYEAYKQLHAAKHISDEEVVAAKKKQAASMKLDAWGGWPSSFRASMF